MKRTRIKPVGKRGEQSAEELKAIRASVLARDGYSCRRCGMEQKIDLHHRLPRSRGGEHTMANLVSICRPCHGLIHGHVVLDWEDWVL